MKFLIVKLSPSADIARNVVRELGSRRRPGTAGRVESRQKGNLKVGVDISPTRDEIKAIVAALQGAWRPILLTAIFTGLRASELRGLRWSDVDLDRHELHVRQRADRFNAIGRPKSASSERTVPLPPIVANALREQQLMSRGDLVFTNGRGKVLALSSIIVYGCNRHKSRLESSARMAPRNIPACTRSAISMQAGASTRRPTAAKGCPRRRCKRGSGTRP